MALKGALSEKAGAIEGIVDTGVVAMAHFENPARRAAFRFMAEEIIRMRQAE